MGGSIVRIDVSKGAKHVVTFVNNLEKDSMYARWPRALKQLSYPTWSLHSIQVHIPPHDITIRLSMNTACISYLPLLSILPHPVSAQYSPQRNLYTLLAVVDPVTIEGAALLLQLQAMHQQQYPLRFGVVLACEETMSLAQYNQVRYDSRSCYF